MLSGRGTPGTNRAMPPEGPVDIVIENGVITDMIPMDAVNAAGYGRNFQRATGDKVIDATGQYVMPGLVEMHAHLPPPNGDLGAKALDLAYRIYLGHGVTTVRDAGTGAGMARMAEQRKQIEANQVVGPAARALPALAAAAARMGRSATRRTRRARWCASSSRPAPIASRSRKSPGHYPDVMRSHRRRGKEARHVHDGRPQGLRERRRASPRTPACAASSTGTASPTPRLGGSQNFPTDYNYWDELDRFRYAGLLWSEADKNPEKLSAGHRPDDQERHQLGSDDDGLRGQPRLVARARACR